ncbi:hypothetical protein [Parachlamydia sp. AcF125]|uniref:hypothetical protein n=1 Tax=Parachlamydia sp. AcF125 TaxID=2795736 RepID=UPI001BC9F667|nr:hypothetical protein [Parachlamydia sp. AcF125]MBS4167767.1 hypothetical protein [Parachlamydia sp. AcF125]
MVFSTPSSSVSNNPLVLPPTLPQAPQTSSLEVTTIASQAIQSGQTYKAKSLDNFSANLLPSDKQADLSLIASLFFSHATDRLPALQIVKSWNSAEGAVILARDSKEELQAYVQKNGQIAQVSAEWIVGIPKEIRKDARKLASYLEDTYIHLNPLKGGYKLYINPRLRGGGFLSLIPSVISFFTKSAFGNLIEEAGSEARATIQVGGNEIRASIDRAEVAANKTLSKMGREIRQSIDKAQSGATSVLKVASSETEKIIGLAGIEARYTSKVLELQVEKALSKAAKEAELVFATAGLEAQKTIQFGGEEARKTCIAFSREVNSTIKLVGKETHEILTQGGREVKEILDKANKDAKAIIHEAGEEFSIRSLTVIRGALEEAEKVVHTTIKQTSEEASNLIRMMGEEANGVVLNLGSQGRLLIKDTGQEIRLIADEVLSKAFAGQEMIIKAAGQEARLTVQEVGKQVCSTLYEIPYIAGLTAQQVGRNFSYGLKDGFWGTSEAEMLINNLKNLIGSSKGIKLEELLEFVYDQHQLIPQDKASLYKELIKLFNGPQIKDRETIFLFIGAAAIKDKDLIHKTFYRTADLSIEVINGIPGNVKTILEEKQEDALDCLLPVVEELPLDENDKIDPLALQLEEQKLFLLQERAASENLKVENELLRTLLEEERKSWKEKNEIMELKTQEGLSLQKEIEELTNEVKKLKKIIASKDMDIQFLSPAYEKRGKPV